MEKKIWIMMKEEPSHAKELKVYLKNEMNKIYPTFWTLIE
jgi:hypothetical protein